MTLNALAMTNGTFAGTTTYQYDTLGRLTSVGYTDGSQVTYQYDTAGNRTQITKAPPAPIVSNKTLSVAYNTTGTVSLTPSGAYTSVSKMTGPTNGSVLISGTAATYTPSSTFYGGTDSFTYNATGPGGTSNTANVTITVGTPPAPTVSTKTLNVSTTTAGTVSLAPSGVWTSVALVANASHGTVSVNATTGVATYTSAAGYIGNDSFTFKATGPGGTSGNGTVNVSVSAANHAPTCTSQTITLSGLPSYGSATVSVNAAQILALCTDADGDTITITSPSTLPASQVLGVGVVYVSFPFVVSDGKGGTASGSIMYHRP